MDMKTITKILIGATAIIALASCDRKAEYKLYPFAKIDGSSYTIAENGGTLTIPVTAYNMDAKSGSVTFAVTPNTAKEGENYTFEPSNGVLNFNGNGTQNISINVKNLEGVFSGDLTLTVSLTGTSGDVEFGGLSTRTARVTIKDLDHPLAAILGKWKAKALYGYWGDDYSGHVINIAADEKDVTKVVFTNLDPYLGSSANKGISGQVNDAKTLITIASGQATGYQSTYFQGFNNADPDVADDYDDIYFEVIDAKTIRLVNAYGSRSSSGWYELLYGDAIFEKQ